MKKYLGMYIIRPDFTEDQINSTIEELNRYEIRTHDS